MSRTSSPKKKITKTDAAALAVFFCLAGLLIASAYTSWVPDDECFYYTIPQRLANGDRLIRDDWVLVQFTALLQYIPYRLYTLITGSTEGILLFMRWFFIAVDLSLYAYFYIRLRDKKYCAVVAAGIFCADPFAGLLAVNYYNIGTWALAVIGITLFLSAKRPGRVRLTLAGAALACAVLVQPPLAVVYLAYSLLVMLGYIFKKRRKRFFDGYSFVIDGKVWLWMSVGAAVCAAAFLVFLIVSTGPQALAENLPRMLKMNPYGSAAAGDGDMLSKLQYLCRRFGLVNVILLVLCAVFACVLALVKKRSGPGNGIEAFFRKARAAVFLVSCAVFVSCWLWIFFDGRLTDSEAFLRGAAFPAFFFAVVCCALCEKRDPRMLAFLICAAVCSAPMDLISNFTLLAHGRLAYFPAVFFCAGLVKELTANAGSLKREDAAKKDPAAPKKRFAAAVRGLACAVLLAQICAVCVQANYYPLLGKQYRWKTVRIESGPAKNIYDFEGSAWVYQEMTKDIDTIRDDCKKQGGSFYVTRYSAYCYLSADLPPAAYSTIASEEEYAQLIETYWSVHPEKRPLYIYVPYYSREDHEDENAGVLDVIDGKCDYHILPDKGKVGRIVKVDRWYDAP